MSLADHEIEPEDDDWCIDHNYYRPCRVCRAEADERIAEAMREEDGRQ